MTTPHKDAANVFTNAVVKWGVTILGALIVAGAVSLANRDVYNRNQVDEKIAVERQWSDAQDQMILRSVEQQGKSIGVQLNMIREDQLEIKKMLRKHDGQ